MISSQDGVLITKGASRLHAYPQLRLAGRDQEGKGLLKMGWMMK